MTLDKAVIYRDLGRIDSAIIYPLADVHLGAEEADASAFQSLLAEIKKQKNAFIILNGDLIDNGTKGSVTGPYGQTMRPAEQKREMAKLLGPVRDRILCIIPGNHEGRSKKEVDDCPAYDIAAKLDLEDVYRENAAYMYLEIGRDTTHQRPYRYYGVAQHGHGGGKYTGATVNNLENYAQSIDGLDFAIIAHSHRSFAVRSSKLVLDPVRRVMQQRPVLNMCACSWVYYGGYAVRKMLRPVAMPGANKLLLHGKRFRMEAVI